MTGLLNIFILGLIYGFTTCSFSCMPYLAPYTIGDGRGFRDGIRGAVSFVSGKVFTYSFMGAAAAGFGSEVIKVNSRAAGYMFGAVLIMIGSSIMFRKNKQGCSGSGVSGKAVGKYSGKLPLFALGIMTSILPCLPLSALFITASGSGSAYKGALYGFLFGSGLIISPIVLAGGVLGFISGRLRTESPELKGFMTAVSGFILIFMGGAEFVRALYPGL